MQSCVPLKLYTLNVIYKYPTQFTECTPPKFKEMGNLHILWAYLVSTKHYGLGDLH